MLLVVAEKHEMFWQIRKVFWGGGTQRNNKLRSFRSRYIAFALHPIRCALADLSKSLTTLLCALGEVDSFSNGIYVSS